MAAVVTAFGSDDVRNAMEEWLKIIREINVTVHAIDVEEEARKSARRGARHGRRDKGSDSRQPSLRLRELQPVEEEAREALGRQVAAELRATAKDRSGRTAIKANKGL